MQLQPDSNKVARDRPEVREVQRRIQSGRRWLVLSGAIAIAGVGGWLGYQRLWQAAPTPIAVSLVPVKRDTVEVTLSEAGTVALDGEQTLKSPEDVTVERVFVQTGDRVKAGAPLIILRNRAIQTEKRDQLVENQKAMLDLNRKREVVRERLQQLQQAEQRLKESQDLLRQGFIPETDVQGDRDRVDQARSQVKDAETEQRKAELEVQKGLAALRDIEQRLGDNRLTSPMDAMILGVNVKAGDGAKREAELLTLGDPRRETVALQLSPLNATKVRINQVARVQMIGPNPKTFPGRVVSLSPQASAPSSPNSNQSQAKVDAMVSLDRPSQVLIPGSQVSVEIVLQQRRNVPTLPLEAIQSSDANPFVWFKNAEGRAEKRPVKLGVQNLTHAEIVSGVQVGDRIALPAPDTPLNPGVPLQAEATPASPTP